MQSCRLGVAAGRHFPREGLLGEPELNTALPGPLQLPGPPASGAVLVPVVPAGPGR